MPTAQQPPNLMAEDSAQFEDAFEAIIAKHAAPEPAAPAAAAPTRQEAYEKWQDLKSEGKTWYGGKAQLKRKRPAKSSVILG